MQVVITDDAYHDLISIHDYIASADSDAHADKVMDRLFELATSLAQNPERGVHPHELIALGHREFRQVILKPWRMIFRVGTRRIIIHVIADGRRDMRSLLAQRLLDA